MINRIKNYYIFNEYYDEINNDFWSSYKKKLLSLIEIRYSKNEIAYDLGCGTGGGIFFLKQMGIKNIKGIDLSEKMISKARKKFNDVEFIIGNMLDIGGWEPGDLVICNFDAINYLVDKRDWPLLFNKVSKVLKSNGMFIFDTLTTYDHKEIWPQSTRVIEKDKFVLINHGEYTKKYASMYYTWFIKDDNNLFEKYTEVHKQKSYPISKIKKWLKDSDFFIDKIIDADTGEKYHNQTQRLIFKCYKI